MNMKTSVRPVPPRQQGTALIVALIALVAMISAGFALFRSVDTANMAANNYQFVRTAQQGVDLAVNEALMAYAQSHPNPALRVANRNVNDLAVGYSAVQLAHDASGIPNVLANLPSPAWTAAGPTPSGWPGEQVDNTSRQLRRYVIDRMCNAQGIATPNNCRLYEMLIDSNCDSVNGGGCSSASSEWLPFIRITVRVDGPRNSVSYAQMFMKAE
jgi:Tfp pilus assembly protein PilX